MNNYNYGDGFSPNQDNNYYTQQNNQLNNPLNGNYNANQNQYQYNQYNKTQDYYDQNHYMQNQGYEANGYQSVSLSQNVSQLKECLAQEVIAKSFLFMFVGLLITAFAAFTTNAESIAHALTGRAIFIPLVVIILITSASNYAIRENNYILAGILYTAYSYGMGMIFSLYLTIYTMTSIFSTFLVAAGIFFIMAIFGLVTKIDLSKAGSICLMGLLGIILVSFVNIFIFKSNTVDLVISVIVVLLFVVITAFDTQKIKKSVAISNNTNVLTLALYGAFNLYLDFMNIFLRLLRIFGKRK